MAENDNAQLGKKLDQIIGLLKILAKKDIDELKKVAFSTGTKRRIYELCDGETEILEIAKKAEVTRQYLHATLSELEESGFVTINQRGRNRYPKKVI